MPRANYKKWPLSSYRREVDRQMKAIYGIDWAEACGETEPLENARDDGEKPVDFVKRWGEKYDLVEVSAPAS